MTKQIKPKPASSFHDFETAALQNIIQALSEDSDRLRKELALERQEAAHDVQLLHEALNKLDKQRGFVKSR